MPQYICFAPLGGKPVPLGDYNNPQKSKYTESAVDKGRQAILPLPENNAHSSLFVKKVSGFAFFNAVV